MSIFSRIVRIIRSNFNYHMSGPDIDDNNYEATHEQTSSYAGQPAGSTTDENSDASRDPELARLYANLEVPYGADLKTVTRSWKQLLRQYHPDMHSNNPEKQKIANQLVQELNRSYQDLKKKLTV